MPEIARLTKATFVYGLTSVLAKSVAVLIMPVYTRVFSPADYGVIETLGTTYSLLILVLLAGIDSALFRFCYDNKSPEAQKTICATTLAYAIAAAALGLALLLPFQRPISQAVFGAPDYAGHFGIIFVSAAAGVILAPFINVFRVQERTAAYLAVSVGQVVVSTGIGVILIVVLHCGIKGSLIAGLVANLLALATALFLARSCLGARFSPQLLTQMFRYSLPIVPTSISLWALNLADRYLLLYYVTRNELGLYSIAARFASVVGLAVTAFQVAWPAFALSLMDQPNHQETYARVLKCYLAGTSYIALSTSVFARDLLALLTTPAYYQAAKAVGALGYAAIANGAYTIFAIGINIKKKTFWLLPVTVSAALLNLALNIALVPRYQMLGAAWATFASNWTLAGLTLAASQRLYYVNWKWPEALRCLFVAGLFWYASSLVSAMQNWPGAVAKVAVIIAYPVGLIAIGCFSAEERRALWRGIGLTRFGLG